MSNPAQVIVLAEDIRQSRFIKAWIRERIPQFPSRNIRESPMSNGSGSGAQRVIAQYKSEVMAYLTRHARKWLIVVIDADNLSAQDRLNQLANELLQSVEERIRRCLVNSEQIAHLVPKWSVETWILFLNGEAVNKDTRYKATNRDWDKLIRPASVQLCEWTMQNNPARDCIPSLEYGIRELRKLTFED